MSDRTRTTDRRIPAALAILFVVFVVLSASSQREDAAARPDMLSRTVR